MNVRILTSTNEIAGPTNKNKNEGTDPDVKKRYWSYNKKNEGTDPNKKMKVRILTSKNDGKDPKITNKMKVWILTQQQKWMYRS